MKKLLLCLMAFSLCTLTGCSSSSDDLLSEIQERGEIIIAMEGTWSPWTYHDSNEELVGFDVEVSKAIAKELGVKATFEEGKWDALFTGLESGRYDLVVNGVEYTEERAKKYDFTDPYAYDRVVLVTKDDNTSIHSFEDLKGKTTSNSISSTYETIAESYGATNNPVNTIDETMEMVTKGRVDATLNSKCSYQDYIKVNGNAGLKVVAESEDASLIVIPLQKGDKTKRLREEINKAIAKLQEDGTLKAISEKYFGADITKE